MGFAGSVVILMRLLIHCEIDGSCCETYCIYLEATTRDSVFFAVSVSGSEVYSLSSCMAWSD